MSGFPAVGEDGKAQLLIEAGGKNGALEGGCCNSGAHKEALIEGGKDFQRGADFFSEPRRGQAHGCVFHAVCSSGDVAADRSQAAAWILDQGTDDHVRADVGRFNALHEFPVAVVGHAQDIRPETLDKRDCPADL